MRVKVQFSLFMSDCREEERRRRRPYYIRWPFSFRWLFPWPSAWQPGQPARLRAVRLLRAALVSHTALVPKTALIPKTALVPKTARVSHPALVPRATRPALTLLLPAPEERTDLPAKILRVVREDTSAIPGIHPPASPLRQVRLPLQLEVLCVEGQQLSLRRRRSLCIAQKA